VNHHKAGTLSRQNRFGGASAPGIEETGTPLMAALTIPDWKCTPSVDNMLNNEIPIRGAPPRNPRPAADFGFRNPAWGPRGPWFARWMWCWTGNACCRRLLSMFPFAWYWINSPCRGLDGERDAVSLTGAGGRTGTTRCARLWTYLARNYPAAVCESDKLWNRARRKYRCCSRGHSGFTTISEKTATHRISRFS